jgi:hypothetical protein
MARLRTPRGQRRPWRKRLAARHCASLPRCVEGRAIANCSAPGPGLAHTSRTLPSVGRGGGASKTTASLWLEIGSPADRSAGFLLGGQISQRFRLPRRTSAPGARPAGRGRQASSQRAACSVSRSRQRHRLCEPIRLPVQRARPPRPTCMPPWTNVKGHWFLPGGGHEFWLWHKDRDAVSYGYGELLDLVIAIP